MLDTSKKTAVETIALALLISLASCATFNKGKSSLLGKSTDKEDKRANETATAVIIMQPMAKSPTLSDKPNSYWVNLRTQGTTDLAKMRGLLATGDWEIAIQQAKSHLIKHPNTTEALMGIASGYAMGRRYEMAGYYAMQVLKIQPSHSDALNIAGLRTLMASGNRRADYQDAMTLFQRSIDSDSQQIAAALNLGHLQLELGNSSSASESLKVAAGRCGQCEQGLIAYGVASSRSGRGDTAQDAFNDALKKNSKSSEAMYHLAMNYRANFNNTSKAVQILQDIVSDADGRFDGQTTIKRQANIALRRIKASDRSGGGMRVGTPTVRPHGNNQEQDVIDSD
jgi:tetratricopeptide (TPR) repeat protein